MRDETNVREIEAMALLRLDEVAPFFSAKTGKAYHWFKVNNYSELDTVCTYYGNERHGVLPSAYPAVVCIEHPDYPLKRDEGERYASVHFITTEECFKQQLKFWNKIANADTPLSVTTD